MITLIPERVVNPGFPALIGIVRSSSPLRRTRIWWEATSTFMITASPTVNELRRSS
jgi:hypothetical protein